MNTNTHKIYLALSSPVPSAMTRGASESRLSLSDMSSDWCSDLSTFRSFTEPSADSRLAFTSGRQSNESE